MKRREFIKTAGAGAVLVGGG
ncbi:MAG: twin-arginine translocation signal domain-containing protein, partial [Bacteroidales bacterium]|nr:twin-arginine translocation signal domain-containing protein [Bacteroidales bacterium]